MNEKVKREVPEQLIAAINAALQSAIHPTLQFWQVALLLNQLSSCPKLPNKDAGTEGTGE